jgi:hypothetical protein
MVLGDLNARTDFDAQQSCVLFVNDTVLLLHIILSLLDLAELPLQSKTPAF